MPKTKISEYSTTNSDNTDIESINIAEGCAPSGINNAIRELMVHLKEFQTGASGDAFTFAGGVLISGTANTITGNVLMSGTNTITGSTTATFAAGAVGTPSIAAHGDTNTGIFFPAADTIAFAEGGAEAMRIDSSGNVGIGTSSAGDKLSIESSTNSLGNFIGTRNTSTGTSAGSRLRMGNNASENSFVIDAYGGNHSTKANFVEIINVQSAPLVFGTATTERMRIDSSGRVGIGAAPATSFTGHATLQVGAQAMLAANLTLSSTGQTYLSHNLYYDTGGTLKVFNTTNANEGCLYQQVDGAHIWSSSAATTGTPTVVERAQITSGGDFLIGDTTASAKLWVYRTDVGNTFGARATSATYTATVGFFGADRNTTNNTFYYIECYNYGAGAYKFRVADSGQVMSQGSYDNTTASAANLFVTSAGLFQRSTSSIKYKTQVENIEHSKADAILNLRPVWYRSTCEADNHDWSWYGLIAEEVAEIEPRLVHWGYSEEDYEVVETQEEVQKERTITGEDGAETVETYTETETKKNKQLKADAQLKPEGVQYDRLTVLLLDIVKRQDKRIEALEAEVAAMKAGNGN